MSTVPAVTMQELELEQAELLPSPETLNCWRSHPGYGNSFSFTQVASGIGTTNQVGLINVSALNGDLSGNSLLVL